MSRDSACRPKTRSSASGHDLRGAIAQALVPPIAASAETPFLCVERHC
jgi:hypothetical protein